METRAFIIIDMQAAMFSRPQSPYRSGELLQNIKTLLNTAWMNRVPVIYIQHTAPSGVFKRDTKTWQIYSAIAPGSGEPVLEKTTRDSFYKTELADVLEKYGAKDLIFAGMQSEFCVTATCKRAKELGYRTVLVSDAHSTFHGRFWPAKHIVESCNRKLSRFGVELRTTKELTDSGFKL